MADTIRLGVAGAGWPGMAVARAAKDAGGFKVQAVADRIPDRRTKFLAESGAAFQYVDAMELVADKDIDALVIALPNYLHAPVAVAAMKAGKHVLCEAPSGLTIKEARQIESVATKTGKIYMSALQRRFGPGEQSARQAITKGYAGEVYHARASWLRTRGTPVGTGWYADRTQSGGGVVMDLGLQILDIAWHLLGEPLPQTVFATTQRRFAAPLTDSTNRVEDSASAIIRFAGNKSMELSVAWSINQPPAQNGTVCRIYGSEGAVEVYTPRGALIYRHFSAKGEAKESELKPPKNVHHVALLKHFRGCILGKEQPLCGAGPSTVLISMIEAIYKSESTGRSVSL